MTSRKDMIRDYTQKYEVVCRAADSVDLEVYDQYGVKRGLRDKNGSGVLTGVTNISRIDAFEMVDGVKVPCDGQLWYRGYNVIDLVNDFAFKRFGFEEVAYLLLYGNLPTDSELMEFNSVLSTLRVLPRNFTRDETYKRDSDDRNLCILCI